MTHHCHKDYPDYWSPRLARSHYCQQWILPVRLSVCHAPSNCFFFFVSRWNRAIFWPSVLHVALYKILVLDFWFMPPNAQNLLPKICTKSQIAYKSACMADTPQMFGPTRGFSGWLIQWNHAKCCGADPCCHGNDILANFGYFCTKLPISRLVCNIDRICLGLPRGPTLVAMATTFG